MKCFVHVLYACLHYAIQTKKDKKGQETSKFKNCKLIVEGHIEIA